MASERITLTIPGPEGDREVALSSPNRVLWPKVGITKRELVDYLVTVADPFLAANGSRPVSLQRFPGGIDGESFFSKNPPKARRRSSRPSRSRTTAAGGIRNLC